MDENEKHERLVHEYLHGLDISPLKYLRVNLNGLDIIVPEFLNALEFVQPKHSVEVDLIYDFFENQCLQ